MSTWEDQLRGYRLTTAEITYHLPDHPRLLQTFIWQVFDLAPNYPRLIKFLEYWRDYIDGPLHSVRIMGTEAITPVEVHIVHDEFRLH